MKIDTLSVQYVRGDNYGLPKSTKIHSTANIIGEFSCDENCRIDGNVTITGKVWLGRGVHIATGVRIFGGAGVLIGKHSGIGPGSTLLTATDDPNADLIALHSENELERKEISGPIAIGEYVLIGANCVVLPNVQVADEVIVGALSLITGPNYLQQNRIYAGVPAQMIREREKLRYNKP